MRCPQEFQPLDSAVIPRFAEPATFMRTPYVPSYAGLDIALVGVPFDLGSTNRAGARHGPAQIREMSRLIRRGDPPNPLPPLHPRPGAGGRRGPPKPPHPPGHNHPDPAVF